MVGAFFSAWTRAKELVTDNSNENNYFAEKKNQTIAYLGYGVQPRAWNIAGYKIN